MRDAIRLTDRTKHARRGYTMATMSRQHYEMLAQALGDAVAREADGGRDAKAATFAAYRVALFVAESLADTNRGYDGARFLDQVAGHAHLTAQRLARGGEGVGYSYDARMGIEEATAQRATRSRF